MKGVIVEVDLYYQIRTLYNEGESIRSIARRLNISRPTVKKYRLEGRCAAGGGAGATSPHPR